MEFTERLSRTLANGPYQWQGNQFYENTGFFSFCDAVEGVNANSTKIPGAGGVGLQTALAGYADWIKNEFLPGFCESFGTSCLRFRLSSPQNESLP
jgi:hypothetical protein